MCVDLFKSYRNTGEHWGGGLACPTIHNSMLFRFFGHFSLIFLSYSRFRAFFMRWDAPGGHREPRGYRRGGVACPTLYNGMLLIFWPFFVYFS